MTTYGYFDDAHKEYVITNPKTPVKWINYIGTLEFGGFVDHTGGAILCKADPTYNRITKYIPQLPASDFKGETCYLRVQHPQGERVFSPFFVPTLSAYERYECRVGLGYTRVLMEYCGLRTEVLIFVPLNGHCEVRDYQITNISGDALEVDVVPVLEYTHPDALKQYTNADWIPQTMQSKAFPLQDGRVLLAQYPFMFRDIKINAFTSSLPVSSFETDRACFRGDHEYGTWANPLGLRSRELSNSEALRGDNIAALMHHLGQIQPGETRRLITVLCQEKDVSSAQAVTGRFVLPEAVDTALKEMADFWSAYLAVQQVNTPDAAMNSMINIHNPRQCFITRNWSRYLSLYQLGLGSRGIGFRDSSQDVMAVMAQSPEEAKALLIKLLQVQKSEGCAMHQFNPMTMIGSEGDSLEREDRPHYYGDDHLWAVLAVCAYVKETGKIDFLEEKVPFYNPRDPENPQESGTVLEHLQRAVYFTYRDRGQHGLPLLGYADWNDTINLAGGAESVMVAALFGRALTELADLMAYLGCKNEAGQYREWYADMKTVVNEAAWDGEWYISYFDADGTPLGSHHNDAGQIFAYGQAWPVMAGFAEGERAERALNAVAERLNTAYGIKLSTPGFNGFDARRGGITTYPPGAKENCGIFLHVNPWVIIAETLAGNGARASQYYRQINPAAHNDDIDRYQSEPYVYPQNILSDEHPQFGLGRNAWLSGTASWAYQAAVQHILGVQPTYSGLRIDPCIPSEWDGYEVRRLFRGAWYHIRVENPGHVSRGVKRMALDGEDVSASTPLAAAAGQWHEVMVVLG